MKKTELKKVLKPLIKECIKEVMFEEGVLSGIITEVMRGVGNTESIVETKKQPATRPPVQQQTQLHEERRQALSDINKSAYGGIDLFEGTAPLSTSGKPNSPPDARGPLAGIDANDSGVDISGLMNLAGGGWKQI